MANPQKENGFTSIANEIMDRLIKIRVPGEPMKVLLCIIRKTYGFNKKEDWISLNQFEAATELKKPNICRALNTLISMNLIIKKDNVIKNDKEKIVTYCFQKDYEKWRPLSKKITVIKNDNLPLSKKIPTKYNITKYNNTISSNSEKPELDLTSSDVPEKNKDKYADNIKLIYEFYIEQSGRNPNQYKLSKLRKDKIKARLREGFTVEQMSWAIQAVLNNPWNQGENPNHKEYIEIDKHIFNSYEQTERRIREFHERFPDN